MTTPAPAPAAKAAPAPKAEADPVAAAVAAIARHITGKAPGDEVSALVAFGLTQDQAKAVVSG